MHLSYRGTPVFDLVHHEQLMQSKCDGKSNFSMTRITKRLRLLRIVNCSSNIILNIYVLQTAFSTSKCVTNLYVVGVLFFSFVNV